MDQRMEGQTERPPVKEAGKNYVAQKEAEIQMTLAKIIDWMRTQEYKEALMRASQETKEA